MTERPGEGVPPSTAPPATRTTTPPDAPAPPQPAPPQPDQPQPDQPQPVWPTFDEPEWQQVPGGSAPLAPPPPPPDPALVDPRDGNAAADEETASMATPLAEDDGEPDRVDARCPTCGAPVSSTESFCEACGTELVA